MSQKMKIIPTATYIIGNLELKGTDLINKVCNGLRYELKKEHLLSKMENRSLSDLRTSLNAISKKIDSMNMDAAQLTGILPLTEGKPFWCNNEIDWNDERLKHLKDTFFNLLNEHAVLTAVVRYIEANEQGNLKFHMAMQEAEKFISTHFDCFDDEVNFFKMNNLSRGMMSLASNIMMNPSYLNEVVL